MLAWYRQSAHDHLSARAAHFAALLHVEPPIIAVKDMRSRWGSCSAKGRISLHWALVTFPEEIADYVVVHELAHLKELNHGAVFWRIVGQVLPDYREQRTWLRSKDHPAL